MNQFTSVLSIQTKMSFIPIVLLCLFISISSAQDGLSPAVQQICDSFFDWRIKNSPESATYAGIYDYDEYLNDLSESSYLKVYNESLEFLKNIEELEPTLKYETDINNIEVLKYGIQTFIDGYHFRRYLMPVNNIDGPHRDVEKLFSRMPLKSLKHYEILLRRMEKLPLKINQIITLMKKGVEENITYHMYSMDGIVNGLTNFVVENPEKSPLYDYFKGNYPKEINEEEILNIQIRAKQIILEEIIPAYQNLINYISNEYITRTNISANSMPNGVDCYKQIIRYHTSTNMTAEEIHEIGLSEVETIETKMKQIVNELGYKKMTVQQFSEMLRNDPTNYYNNSEDLMTEYRRINELLIPPHILNIFKTIPKTKLDVIADPSADGTGAFYVSGSLDGTRAGGYYVNTYNLDRQPKYGMMTLSLHEGNPGHHLQISHNLESLTIPKFRKVFPSRGHGVVPSAFPRFTSHSEGWALYAESLGFEMKLYDDPLERYGHYSAEIFRACRLVVDTGIHALGWSRDKAIEYMYAHTANSRNSVEAEIDRYITWPGQALSYKIGNIKFRNLRKFAEEKLALNFDIKQFHKIAIESIGPLNLVETLVTKWIDNIIENNVPN